MSENKNLSWNAADVQAIFEELERDGLIVKTGEYRPGRWGILEPVYAATEYTSRRYNLANECQGSGEDSGQGGETLDRHRPIGIW